MVLAGGLHADNVGDAIVRLRPVAVDVSGGRDGARAWIDGVQFEKGETPTEFEE